MNIGNVDEIVGNSVSFWNKHISPYITIIDGIIRRIARILTDTGIFAPEAGKQFLSFVPEPMRVFIATNSLATGVLGIAAVFLYGFMKKRKLPFIVCLALSIYPACFLAEGFGAAYGAFGVLVVFFGANVAKNAIKLAISIAIVMTLWSFLSGMGLQLPI